MYFCLRIDLDYVPWDTPDAQEFGHGEPAAILRLLELARHQGYKYQFFVSNRALRAFPANAEAVLNDGHDLDWLCKHPDQGATRLAEAEPLFNGVGHKPQGLALKAGWPAGTPAFEGYSEFKFISSAPGAVPPGPKLFPVDFKFMREAIRGGMNLRSWTEAAKTHIRDSASRNRGVTIAVRAQVLGKLDPKLVIVRELAEIASIAGLRMTTLRELALADPGE